MAAENPVQKVTPADVIVVFDVSGSMGNNMNGQTRLARAKTAVNTMADTLLSNNNEVRMALISFSTDATVVQDFTSNYTTFSGKVNNLSAGGGTNWEKALYLANTMAVRSNAATFVVFVTDGDPTFRMSRGDVTNNNLDVYSGDTYQYYRLNAVYGEGNDDSEGRNFDFAVTQVSEIKNANKSFYAIGVSNDVTKVQTLTTQGGVAADHAFIASDSTAMTAAFKSITEAIKSALGFGDVEINDGITELTNSEMKVMETVDPNSFKYYRWGGEGNKYGADEAHKTEWTTREADGCAAASYNEETGAVQWNMGAGFQLENGVHYVVEFRVWASQEAYDLVADLNNGVRTYESLTAEEKAQVVELTAPSGNTPGTYALKTNTNEVSATYKKTTKTGETVTISDDQPITATYHEGTIQNIALESMKLTIKKEFEDDLTAGEDRETEVVLQLLRRAAHQTPEAGFEPYAVPQGGTTSANIVLNDENNWTFEIYVAPGVMANGEVLEHGYDFSIQEPGIDYHYSLIEEIINPMVVDGVDTFLGDGWLIDDQTLVAEYKDNSLTAVNRVKSGIDITKVLLDPYGQEITPEVEFTIKGQLLDADGNPFTWQEGDDVNHSGAYHKYDKDGNRIVYKGHFADTSNIEFTLKPGERIRFINVPEGCTFEFYEVLPSGSDEQWYEWVSTTAVTQHRVSAGGEFTTEGDVQPVVEDGKAIVSRDLTLDPPLTGVVGNKQYSVTFTNKTAKGEWFYVYHSSDNTVEQIFVTDDRVTVNTDSTGAVTSYTFNIVNETKSGFLYGGYYKAYSGASENDEALAAETYTKDGNGRYWFTDSAGTAYTAATANVWIRAQAYTGTVEETGGGIGTAMTVVGGEIYYLKEVPNGYIRPYIHYTYDERAEGNPITHLYVITAADDKNYAKVGYVLSTGTELTNAANVSLAITIKKYDGTIDALLTASGVYKEKKYQDGKVTLPRGYLYWSDVTSTIGIGNDFTYRPTWETLDGVKVGGFTVRSVTGSAFETTIAVEDVAP